MTKGSSCFSLIVVESKFSCLFLYEMKLIPCQIMLVYLFGMLREEESITEKEIKHLMWNSQLKFRDDSRDMIHIALRNVAFYM